MRPPGVMNVSSPRLDQSSNPPAPLPFESQNRPAEFNSPSGFARSGGPNGRVLFAGGLIAVVAVAFFAGPRLWERLSPSEGDDFAHLLTDVAFRGPFLLTVNIQGNLDSQKNVTVNSNVQGTTTIISIVPEGTWVEESETVCVLDSSVLQDQAAQQEIVVTNADAAKVTAEQELEVQKTQNKSDIAAADLQLVLAKLDLEKYEFGEYNKLESELKGNLSLAKEEAVQAGETHAFNKQQVKKGNISQKELEASRIQKEKFELAVSKADEELKVLVKYDRKRTMAELTANSVEYERELERARLKAKAAEVQALQSYAAAKKSAELERSKWEKLLQQIENCTLKAPQAGEVVYANLSSRGRGRSDGPAIEEGASVQERQAIFNLPDISRMKVDARIHESLIANIHVGLPAKIEVAGKHDMSFRGEIAHVSTVPMTGSWPNYDLREYQIAVNITDDPEKVEQLKPGLTAQVEIFVDSRDDVLQVPVQAVVGLVGKYFAFVLKPDGPERREVKIGQSNDTAVEIIDGVAESEQVVLNPRTNFAEEIAELLSQLGAESSQQDANENPSSGTPHGATAKRPRRPASGSPSAAKGPAKSSQGDRYQGGEPQGGGPGNPSQMFAALDADKNGKLSGDEIPAPMKSRLSSIDTDSDGAISQAEMTAAIKRMRGGGGGGKTRPNAAGG